MVIKIPLFWQGFVTGIGVTLFSVYMLFSIMFGDEIKEAASKDDKNGDIE